MWRHARLRWPYPAFLSRRPECNSALNAAPILTMRPSRHFSAGFVCTSPIRLWWTCKSRPAAFRSGLQSYKRIRPQWPEILSAKKKWPLFCRRRSVRTTKSAPRHWTTTTSVLSARAENPNCRKAELFPAFCGRSIVCRTGFLSARHGKKYFHTTASKTDCARPICLPAVCKICQNPRHPKSSGRFWSVRPE